jgi:hypothetical protein
MAVIDRLFRKNKKYKIFSLVCAVISALLLIFARVINGFSNIYARYIIPIFANTLGKLMSIFPFSVFELLIYCALIFIVFGIVYIIWKIVKKDKDKIFSFLWCTTALICGFFMLMTATTLVNYSRDPITLVLSMDVEMYTANELLNLTELLVKRTNELAEEVFGDSENYNLTRREIINGSVASMQKLGGVYDDFSGYYSRPKSFLFSRGLSYMSITGIFSPFTFEPHFSSDVIDYVIPFTICHELAHSRGFMREDDANFIAYLATKDSDINFIRLSAEMNILAYALRAYRRVGDTEEYSRLYNSIDERVLEKYRENAEHWRRFDTPVARVSTAANDLYLRANAQSDGVQSYGRVIDLVYMLYRDDINK